MNIDINWAIELIDGCENSKDLQEIESKYLSREHGLLILEMKNLAKLSGDEKREFGKKLNECKVKIINALSSRSLVIGNLEIEAKIQNESIDVTAPANYSSYNGDAGSIHPITKTINDLKKIANEEGFAIFDGYDVESAEFNFDMLNTHKLHSARQTQDTIYIDKNTISNDIRDSEHFGSKKECEEEFLLRTHTSAQEIRISRKIIEKLKAQNIQDTDYEFKYATFGRTYRNESDGTHSPMFHQMEMGCVSDTLFAQDLIDVMMVILSKFFKISTSALKIRLRPSYFPFTGPSWEIDVFLPSKGEYVEILGCGMSHPKVIENIGLDSSIYRGYALGAGIERLCMLKYAINDLRPFFGCDLDWLKYHAS
jgi:phenylalanyl-tRNA synthetase alpha chain